MSSKDSLFLLEVLVDKVTLSNNPCLSDTEFKTCITVACPAVPPIEICDNESVGYGATSGGPFTKNFNVGKSCLFSMKEADMKNAMSKFPVVITVFKMLPCGCLPAKVVLGEAAIDMTKEFVQARNKYLEDPNIVSHQALKDCFRLSSPDNKVLGTIDMFLRISCFGNLIVTRFQGQSETLTVGQSNVHDKHDRPCNPPRELHLSQDPCVCGATTATQGLGGLSGQSCSPQGRGHGSCPPAQFTYGARPCEYPDDPCYCRSGKPIATQQMTCRNVDAYGQPIPKDCCPTGNKVIFQMPADSCALNHKQRAHFTFNSDGVGDVTREEPGQLMPITADEYRGVVYDYAKDVIKLRIGKTIEMPGRKTRLEYQFITPSLVQEKKVPVTDTRGAQCLTCCSDDCCPPSLPLNQEITAEGRRPNQILSNPVKVLETELSAPTPDLGVPTPDLGVPTPDLSVQIQKEGKEPLTNIILGDIIKHPSNESVDSCIEPRRCSLGTISSKRCSVSFANTIGVWDSNSESIYNYSASDIERIPNLFGKTLTAVYMTFCDDVRSAAQTSGTQATASLNKCLQVCGRQFSPPVSNISSFPITNSNWSVSSNSTVPKIRPNIISGNSCHKDVYFFERQKKTKTEPSNLGMGNKQTSQNIKSDKKLNKCLKPSIRGTCTIRHCPETAAVQTNGDETDRKKHVDKNCKCNGKYEKGILKEKASCGMQSSITPGKQLCFGGLGSESQCGLVATVSHIRIAPKPTCITHGLQCCTGLKCLIASNYQDEPPVNVTTMSNSRRGVFELVVRRMTGNPLARNELLLEWTPPQCLSSPRGNPCSPHPKCGPSKCKMIVCKPRCKTVCKKPCALLPCDRGSCRKCSKAASCPRPCGPPPPCCRPPRCCSPSPCQSPPVCRPVSRAVIPYCREPTPCLVPPPCPTVCCGSTCKNSCCLRTCPIGRGRLRRCKSHPRMRQRKVRISPCLNRPPSLCRPIRCLSTPAPGMTCLPCPPRKCCSLAPCKPRC